MGIKIEFGMKVLEQLWAQENDISNLETLKLIANDLKINFEDLNKLAMSDKIKNIYTNKRFKLLCSLSVLLHILGACWVLYTILYNPLGMNNSLNFGRYLIGLDDHNHNIENIFECWLLSIQIRYVITDFYVFYNAMINKRLLKHTIQIHGIESFVCCSIFYYIIMSCFPIFL